MATLSFLLEVFAPDFCIRSPSDEKINTNRYKRERQEKNYFLYIYTYIYTHNVVGDAFYERGVVKVCVAVVAKEYSWEDGDCIVVKIIVQCEETR